MGEKHKILTRQDSLFSSSSRRKAMPTDRNNHVPACSVGCMSSFLHLFSKYHTRRKFLTSGKKQENPVGSLSPRSREEEEHNKVRNGKKEADTCASSVVQEEHRRPTDHHKYYCGEKKASSATPTPLLISSNKKPPETGSAVVVARLMGLDDGFPAPAPASSESASAEKREELLRSLEKCDEDLRSLKKIIEALRSDTAKHHDDTHCHQYYSSSSSPPAPAAGVILKLNKETAELNGVEEPSPDSVLHQFSPPSPPPHAAAACFPNKRSNKGATIRQQLRKKPRGEECRVNFSLINKSMASVGQWRENVASSFSYRHRRISKAMSESVGEVWHDVAWGEKTEMKRIGLALKEGIWKDLIEEIVKDMDCLSGRVMYYLPSAGRCRRRLSL